MEKLKWMFELQDRMSGPAGDIIKQLDSLTSKMRATKAASAGDLTKSFGAARVSALRFAAAAQANRGPLGGLHRMMSRVALGGFSVIDRVAPRATAALVNMKDRALPALKSVGAGLAGFTSTFAGVGATAAVAVGGLAVLGGKWALGALAFRENTMAAFKAMLGSERAAASTFAAAQKFAAETPFTTEQVVGSFQRLITGGFRGEQLTTLMKAAGDVGSLMGADKMDQVITALSQIQAKGKLSGEEMMQLAEAGISQKVVYETLAKTLGKTTDEVRKLGETGKITSAQGIAAITETIRTTLSGGELGGAMAAQSKTLTGLFSTLASAPFDLMMAADSTALEPLKNFIVSLTDALKPTSEIGQRIVGIFNKIGASFASLFTDANGGRDINVTLRGILNIVEPLIDGFLAFGRGAFSALKSLFKPLLDVSVMMGEQPGLAASMTKTFEFMGEIFGTVLAAIIYGFMALAAAVVGFFDAMRRIRDWANEFGAELKNNWRSIGVSIIESLIDGIMSMLNPLGTVASAISERLVSGTGAGTMGTSPATRAAAAAVPPVVQRPNVTASIGNIAITVPDAKNPTETAKGVAGSIKDQLAAELGKLGLGFGG